ncbi:MAG TPA: hypothetical protein ENG87_02640 [Candidatus Pacearchaeota archaeon]|nr:hypothetical protein BMS3Abin17_01320 [archaeon BMS3Abin17]HDK42250.1 hypothetical protein [Candidatus Pacearchaeota archaeon]HDZ60945.1 hypothetical protein [Candidatus Pacearchaeota archaeon]
MKTALLESLKTGSKVKIQSKQRLLYLPYEDDIENPRNPEISTYESPIKEYSLCWEDFYKETDLIIFGDWSNKSDLYEACVYPSNWISKIDNLFIVELPNFKYINRIMKDNLEQRMRFKAFYDISGSNFAKILARAIDGRSPSQYEIESFRNSKPHHDIFNAK